MSKATIPIVPIDFDLAKRTVDQFSKDRNVPAQIYPQSVNREGEGAPFQPPPVSKPVRTPTRKFTVELPEYVIDAIQQRALSARPKQTARYVVLEALKAIGIDVGADDLVPDGRRTSR